ncbi:MAG: OadG family protein [Bacteroidetes bacterium]|jgi:Na+-transporting methylmalonyl-CoA/oxaloacetate decarboxylase gamma subunit|nr:OadG family protein [Bacteroidota bacterium]MBU1580443.1 OadG family protein [Bacteroidota bacterium]MBU2557110.1 OadG family protein [Bacteroidota bacterium]MDA3944125.1 OadG family protein [Bacteroidota bacterium]
MLLLTDFVDVPETTLIEGVVISIVGYLIVFVALVVLYFVFFQISKLINMQLKSKLRRQGKLDRIEDNKSLSIPGEVAAAISMALYISCQLHDEESNVLTIKKVSRVYSPWSSKIYGLRNLNR